MTDKNQTAAQPAGPAELPESGPAGQADPEETPAPKDAPPESTAGPAAEAQPDEEETPAESEAGEQPAVTQEQQPHFPIAALCASAGGLETLQQFFGHMPPNSGMALVVVTHLHPSHVSKMSQVLQRHTEMEVREIQDGMVARPNQVYVIPPNFELGIIHGVFHLLELSGSEVRVTIDTFLRSLARDQGRRAMAVIMSGSGHDGSLGLKDIKEQGGLVVAQEPETALHPGMPRSAVGTGLVDFVLPVAEIPGELLAYVERGGLRETRPGQRQTVIPDDDLQKIFMLLRSHTNHDFSHYKKSTIQRRLVRRMAVTNNGQMKDYITYLRQHPDELEALFKEFLIGVTQFFRDPEAYEQLKAQVLPHLFEDRSLDQPIRVWVPGCATGEEAYSLAILLQEEMQRRQNSFKTQIFATDIDAAAIEQARRPKFPASIARDVSKERLKRFFSREDDLYSVRADIREMVIFAVQDLLGDPPFSNLDLISCRNLLIYLEPALQRRVLALCHYGLRPNGYLWLGPSESLGELAYAFTPVDRKWRIFQRLEEVELNHSLESEYYGASALEQTIRLASGERRWTRQKRGYHELVEGLLLKHYRPTAALINKNYDLLYTYGDIDRYLKLPAGQASLNILELARTGLKLELTTGLRHLDDRTEALIRHNVRVRSQEAEQLIDLSLQAIPDSHLILVIFQPVPAAPSPPAPAGQPDQAENEPHGQRVAELEQELRETKKYLQNTVEDLQTTNEELKSANEELQTANEELQSANEELKTAREEEQSVNEELNTVNAEIQERNEELTKAKNDLNNLLVGTQIAILFLDDDLRIRNFTPEATHLFNLIEADLGRPLEHVTSKLLYDHLIEDAEQVLQTLDRRGREIRSESGQWYKVRLMPYRTLENVIEGVVLTFEEITGQKEVEQQLRQANERLERLGEYTQNIIDTVPDGLVILSESLHLLSANRSFYRMFDLKPAQAEGELLFELDSGSWMVPELRRWLEKVVKEDDAFQDKIITGHFPRVGRRRLRLSGRRLLDRQEELRLLFVIEDIGEEEADG